MSKESEPYWQPCTAVNWRKLQVKRAFAITLGKMLQSSPAHASDSEVTYLKAQHVQWDGITLADLPTMWASEAEVNVLLVKPGDLLVCEGGEVGRSAIVGVIPKDRTIIQNALHLVRGRNGANPRFLHYLLRQAYDQGWFNVICNKSTIAHFTVEKFEDMWAWLPDNSQQRAIADYLDSEIARIDALIAEKERLLDLLAEKRRALITRAVTRGVDPNVPLRDSGISWLGEIPVHWETRRARWLFSERDERSDSGEEDLLTVSHLTGVTLRSEKDVNMFEAETKGGYKICFSGDLVINTMWAWMGAMGVSSVDGIVSPAYNVYEPKKHLNPSYVDALVRLSEFTQEVTRYSKGVWSSRLRLYPEGFFAVSLPVPPLGEQREIVGYIAKTICKLNELQASTERAVSLLNERRSALIAAAVTGKTAVIKSPQPA